MGKKKSLNHQKKASKPRNCYFLVLFNVIHARIYVITECCGQAVSTPALHSGYPGI
jgi:hypothetical protein